jgi:hypothetical protein
MILSSPLFEAFLECDTKCWLRARAETGTGNIYAQWIRLKNETYCEDGRKRLVAMFPEIARTIAAPLAQHAKDSTWRLATDVRLQTNRLASSLQGIEKAPPERRNKPLQFIPYRFQFTNKITKNHKLSLCIRRACAFRSDRVRRESRQDHARRRLHYVEGEAPSSSKSGAQTSHGDCRTVGTRNATRPCTEPALRPVRIPIALS